MQKTKHAINVLKYEDNVPIYTSAPDVVHFAKHNKQQIEVKPVPGVDGAYVLTNVLSPEECQQFIDISEQMGYDVAKITTSARMILDTEIRNNKRVMWQSDTSIWKPLWKRIRKHISSELKIHGNLWTPYGLNERFRFYRYHKGEIFNKHYDAAFVRAYTDKSFLTAIFYLNSNFEGGKTTFYPSFNTHVPVQPEQGSALLFWHGSHPSSPLHEGSLCTNGVKYVLRSDVMFVENGTTPFITVSDNDETS